MLDENSLKRLRCPVTFDALTAADEVLIDRLNQRIETQGVPTRGGDSHRAPIEGGLMTRAGEYLYPIQDGIVCMLAERAIDLTGLFDASE